MSKLLVVFGATGQQGGSIVEAVLNDPGLSKQYRIRGVTRDTTSTAAQKLASKGVEVMSADLEKPETVEAVLEGANTVVGIIVTAYDESIAYSKEWETSLRLVDATIAAGAEYLIWSSMVSPRVNSKGAFTTAVHFDVKYDVEQYIRKQNIKATYFVPGSFMQNLQTARGPRKQDDGTYAIFNLINSDTVVPWIDVVRDTGKWIAPALANPDKYNGVTIYGISEYVTQAKVVDILGKHTGKTVVYKQVPDEVFSGFVPPSVKGMITAMNVWIRDYGYLHDIDEQSIKQSEEMVKGKTTSLEEFLRLENYTLE